MVGKKSNRESQVMYYMPVLVVGDRCLMKCECEEVNGTESIIKIVLGHQFCFGEWVFLSTARDLGPLSCP